MKIAALVDRDTAVGLRLAGIKDVFIPKDGVIKLWSEITDRDDIGIVFITEKIAEDLDKHLKDYRLRNNIPIFIEIPDKNGRKKDHVDFVSHLIKKAVGVEVGKEK